MDTACAHFRPFESKSFSNGDLNQYDMYGEEWGHEPNKVASSLATYTTNQKEKAANQSINQTNNERKRDCGSERQIRMAGRSDGDPSSSFARRRRPPRHHVVDGDREHGKYCGVCSCSASIFYNKCESTQHSGMYDPH